MTQVVIGMRYRVNWRKQIIVQVLVEREEAVLMGSAIEIQVVREWRDARVEDLHPQQVAG